MKLLKLLIVISIFFTIIGCTPSYGEVKFPIDSQNEAVLYAKNITKNDKDIVEFIQLWEKRGYKVKYIANFHKKSNKWDVLIVPEQILDACYSIIFTTSGQIIEKSECQGI